MKNRTWYLSPYTVTGFVIIMYLIKVSVKLAVGHYANSPVIAGDGYHNVADIFEALGLVLMLVLSRRPPNNKFRFGLKRIESIGAVFISLGLLYMAFQTAVNASDGVARWGAYFLVGKLEGFMSDPLKMGPQYFWWVTGIMAGSAVLSFLVCHYEISVGKRTGHDGLVADGVETKSDGMIETTALVGILCEYFFKAAWIEYPLALVIAYLMTSTSISILTKAFSTLLQRSLDEKIVAKIMETCLETPGVFAHEKNDIKTYSVGSEAFVYLDLGTRCRSRANNDIAHGLVHRVKKCLLKHEFDSVQCYITLFRIELEDYRRAYAVRKHEKSFVIADSIESATNIVICDMKGEDAPRWTVEDKTEKIPDCIAFLLRKKVREFYTFYESAENIALIEKSGIACKQAVDLSPN